ncbi:type II toxin-antitoxin system Phd/YefM family antitoxin [Oceanobacillus sp. Castelsardo]|uniref:type II toxin-antitoxin system Phd/YefM family antitoxin n=1 Tax=Oceanobacillus sp. Castelsardo TaxID=1851204 RepID=UPI000837F8EC|nr:type II toxin-antitoxin system Phd/YefM family antitoxin [Oceanobacillus sp. Castelsardo]
MYIKPSAAIRNNYNEISNICKESVEPVYLTKNGEGDLVVMDMKSFERREKMLQLREKLVKVEENRLSGMKGFSLDEVDQLMKKTINEYIKADNKEANLLSAFIYISSIIPDQTALPTVMPPHPTVSHRPLIWLP